MNKLRSQAGPRISIKDRVGLGPMVKQQRVGGGGNKGNNNKLQVKLASRLGLPVKSRIGGAKGKTGNLMDARQKILLNRVSKGRVGGGRLGDARAKIEAKRVQKKVLTSKASNIKSLRITANLATAAAAGGGGGIGGMGSNISPLRRQQGLTTAGARGLMTRPGLSRSSGIGPGGRSVGGMRSAGGMRSSAGGGGMRSAGGGMRSSGEGMRSSEGMRSGEGMRSSEGMRSPGGIRTAGGAYAGSPGYQREPMSQGYFANLKDSYPMKPGGLRVSVQGGGGGGPSFSSSPSSSGMGRPSGMGPGRMDPSENLFLTRTVSNPNAASSSAGGSRSWNSSVAKVAPSFSRSGGGYGMEDMEMDEESPPRIRISNSLQSRLDSYNEEPSRYRLLVSNLQQSVTTEDIVELFSDINTPISAQITSSGHAEVVYSKKSDCLKAVEAYHNRLLDGSPMRVVLEASSTTLKSAGGATMKLPKASSSVKIQPDISAIHKVLFNPSSGNSTRGLFKGGQ